MCEHSHAKGVVKLNRRSSQGMHDPTNNAVDRLACRECLMPAFVSDDPKTHSYKASAEAVHKPRRPPSDLVEHWMR